MRGLLIFVVILFLGSVQAEQDKAKELFGSGDYEKASELFYDRYVATPHDKENTFNLALSYFYGKKLDEALVYFKKVIATDPKLKPVALLLMAKIYFAKKKYKSATATIGKGMSIKDVPGPVYMSFLDLWELLNKKQLNYVKKGDEYFNQLDVNTYLQGLLSDEFEALDEEDIKILRLALESYQLAWVLDPNDKILEKIVQCYIILGEEEKSSKLLLLVDENKTQKELGELFSKRKEQLEKKIVLSESTFEEPSIFELDFEGGVIGDSNPSTRARVQNLNIEEVQRNSVDLSLGLNAIVTNDFILKLRYKLLYDGLKTDPIQNEDNTRSADFRLVSVELPGIALTKSSQVKVTPSFEHYTINDDTFFSTAGVNMTYEKYFNRYATFIDTWFKVNNGYQLSFYDGQNWGGNVGIFRYTKKSNFGFVGGYRKEHASDFDQQSFQFFEKSLEMKGERKVSKRMTLGLALALGLKTYMSEREDEKFNFIGFLQYRLLPKTFVKVRYDFFDNTSTDPEYEFRQHRLGSFLVGEYF